MFAKRYILPFALALSLVSAALTGCGGSTDQSVTFSQLISQADKHNGKTVTLEAFYFSGFEIMALAGSLGPAGEGRGVPIGTLIWVEGGIPQELQSKMHTQTVSPSGYIERLGKLKVTGRFEAGGKYGHLGGYQYQIAVNKSELLEWSPPPPQTDATPTDEFAEARAAAQKIAEAFIRNSATFRFDGLDGSVKLVRTDPGVTSAFRSWSYTFEFQTRHPGHGDRTGQFLAQVITNHRATILVNLEKDIAVMAAVCDDTWDMLREKELPVTVSGIVVSGGDTTSGGGPVGAPRIFVYRILRDDGSFVNVSYAAYSPSPDGDAARAKITLDFYQGTIEVGDRMEARGVLNKETNTVMVAEQDDFIKTMPHKATVVGVIISIGDRTPPGSPAPRNYVYELLREDGTVVNVSYAGAAAVAVSLYSDSIRVGDYMKVVGTYDRSTNTVIAAEQGDLIKTYVQRP